MEALNAWAHAFRSGPGYVRRFDLQAGDVPPRLLVEFAVAEVEDPVGFDEFVAEVDVVAAERALGVVVGRDTAGTH